MRARTPGATMHQRQSVGTARGPASPSMRQRGPGGTRLMESDSWLYQCTSRDLIGFSILSQRVSLAQDPAPLPGLDGMSSERACGAALPTRRAGDGVPHGPEMPGEQAPWSCVSSGYTEVARQMFPGRAPILQWGIKKGDAQSSLQRRFSRCGIDSHSSLSASPFFKECGCFV